MDWARLLVGAVLLLSPCGIHANKETRATSRSRPIAQTSPATPSLMTTTTATRTTTTFAKPSTKVPTTTRPPPTRPPTTQPPTTTVKDELKKTIQFADQDITFVQNNADKSQFRMCVGDTGSPGDCKCFEFTKEGCNKESCWKIQDKSSDAQRLNYIIGVLGGTIGLLLVVLVATTVAFLCAHASKYQRPGYVQHENEPKTSSVQERKSPDMKSQKMESQKLESPEMESVESYPTVPRRPDRDQDDNGGYIMGKDINPIKPWLVAEMEHQSGLQGDVRMTMTEYGME